MKLDKDALIAGYPTIKIRDLLKGTRHQGLHVRRVMEVLDLDGQQALKVMDDLAQAGILQAREDYVAQVGNLGFRLRAAKFAPRISREKAEQMLDAFIGRVAHVNADPAFLSGYCVVHMFGSMIGDAEEVGDIDLCLIGAHKGPNLREWKKQSYQQSLEAGGPPDVNFAHRKTERFVRNKSAYLSFHDVVDCLWATPRSRIIYVDEELREHQLKLFKFVPPDVRAFIFHGHKGLAERFRGLSPKQALPRLSAMEEYLWKMRQA